VRCGRANWPGSGLSLKSSAIRWNGIYGEYEGRLSVDIMAKRPDWQLFRDGCPRGESPQQVAERADRVIRRLRRVARDVLLLGVASLSMLSHKRENRPAIRLWNTAHTVARQTASV
jgi:broad specificity phosphatase PhoE